MAIIGFIVGYVLVHTVLETIESGVATLFVCIAEEYNKLFNTGLVDSCLFLFYLCFICKCFVNVDGIGANPIMSGRKYDCAINVSFVC